MKRIIFTATLTFIVLFSFVNCDKISSYERGIITETSYESKYLNLRFDLPQGFEMASEEKMLEIMNIGSEIVDNNKLAVKIAKLTTIYEMMVSAPIGYPNLSIMVEKPILSSITIEQYLNFLKTNLLKLEKFKYEIREQITSAKIAGQSYKKLTTFLSDFNIIQDYIVRKQGNRIICFIITYTSDSEKEMELLIDGFTKLTN